MRIDPITVEVVRNAVNAYADEMATALCKSAYNMMIYEVRDFCCGLIDGEGRMISQNQGGLPIFLADLGVAVEGRHRALWARRLRARRRRHHESRRSLRPASQQHRDLRAVLPRRQGRGFRGEPRPLGRHRRHARRASARSKRPRSIRRASSSARSRSTRRASATRRCGRSSTTTCVFRKQPSAICARRSHPANSGIGALPNCCAAMVARPSRPVSAPSGTQTEHDARAFIAKIPDGVYEAESFLDNDGRTLDVTLRIKVKVTIDGERMIVDFSQMNDQVPGPTNSGLSGGLAAARVAFKCLTQPHAPVNEGCFRPLEVILPPRERCSTPSRRLRSACGASRCRR